jgi:PIN domain nuclease of toxin-antitoxin system
LISNDHHPSIYVLDTHALFWYWTAPLRLGTHAGEVFELLGRGQALGLVSLIVVAELHYLTAKLHQSLSVEEILHLIDRAPYLRLEGLTRRHLLAFGDLYDVPEMHGRFIGAIALVHDAPVVSRDATLRDHPKLRVVW